VAEAVCIAEIYGAPDKLEVKAEREDAATQ
jgi:hypothetical protein